VGLPILLPPMFLCNRALKVTSIAFMAYFAISDLLEKYIGKKYLLLSKGLGYILIMI